MKKASSDIFKNNTISELKNKLSVVPWFKAYIEQIPQEFLEAVISGEHPVINVNIKNDMVIEASLQDADGSGRENWKYYLAEPYPGIRILSGNITGLMKLNGIGTGIPDTRTSVLHYCAKGRCEIQTNDGMYAFMEPGVLCVESHKRKEKNFNFYGEEYEGVEIAFELDTFDDEQKAYLKSLGVDIYDMEERFNRDAEYYIGNVTDLLKASELELDTIMKGESPDGLTLFLSVLRINNLVKNGHILTDDSKFYLTKGQRKIVSEIHDYFLNHISEDITVEQMADKYKLSHVSLNKYFRVMYGDTIHKYMQNYRMGFAAKELAKSTKSVAEIAALVGYDNQSKFSGAFKKKYGMTPLEYRRSAS